MKTSESIKNIAEALNKAQAQITAAKKDAKNPFFKSTYADLGSVILAIKEAYSDNGLSYIQSPLMEAGDVGVTTRIMHLSGEWIEGTLMLPVTKIDAQGAGSAITYARRYALQAMTGVPAADDDAEFSMGRKEAPAKSVSDKAIETVAPQPATAYIAEVQKTKILDALKKAEYPLMNFLVKSNVKSLDLLELSRFEGALAHIESVAKSKVKKGE